MRAKDFLTEAPVTDYEVLGKLDKPGPLNKERFLKRADAELKVKEFFSKTSQDIRMFFANRRGLSKYSETGSVDDKFIYEIFSKEDANKILSDRENTITIVYVGNQADDKIALTPWIMAHRLGHAIQASVRSSGRNLSSVARAWNEVSMHFFHNALDIISDYYEEVNLKKSRYDDIDDFDGRYYKNKKRPKTRVDYDSIDWYQNELNALFNAVGTQGSSRRGQISRPFEFIYEAFAQYLGTGQVTFNPLPKELNLNKKKMVLKSDITDRERTNITGMMSRDLEILFNDVLANSEGHVFIM